MNEVLRRHPCMLTLSSMTRTPRRAHSTKTHPDLGTGPPDLGTEPPDLRTEPPDLGTEPPNHIIQVPICTTYAPPPVYKCVAQEVKNAENTL